MNLLTRKRSCLNLSGSNKDAERNKTRESRRGKNQSGLGWISRIERELQAPPCTVT